MKFFYFISLVLLPITSFAAQKNTQDRYSKYHSRSRSTSPLKLDDDSYEGLTNTPRDYTAVVLLTALEARFGCQMCREFQPEWDLIAKSWTKGDRNGASRVLYGTLDFVDGKGTFQKVSSAGIMSS